jgi:hypothetical protein
MIGVFKTMATFLGAGVPYWGAERTSAFNDCVPLLDESISAATAMTLSVLL